MKGRAAIAAEAVAPGAEVEIPNIPKTDTVLRLLGENLLLHSSSQLQGISMQVSGSVSPNLQSAAACRDRYKGEPPL